jgi:hypothetical protein
MPPWNADGGNAYEVPEIYDVVCTGIFNPEETPAAIIKDMLFHYCGLSKDGYTYKLPEFDDELAPLEKIGLYIDQETDIFAAVEKIQNASTYAFQSGTAFNKFTTKRNDDNRAVSKTIKQADILNIDELEIDMNLQEYATVVDVAYAENHMDDKNRDDNYEHISTTPLPASPMRKRRW